MKQKNLTGIFVIAALSLPALLLIFLIGRKLTAPAHTPPSEITKSSFFNSKTTFSERETPFRKSFIPPSDSPPPTRSLEDSSDPFAQEWNNKGLVSYTKGDYKTAAENFRKALRKNPMNAVLRQNLAYAKGSLGWQRIASRRYQDALLDFQEALNLDIEDPTFYMGMGLAYYHLSKEEPAIEMLQKAIARQDDYAQPYKLLGEIYYTRDEMDLAVGYLEKAQELDSSDQNLTQRLAKARREQKTQGNFQQQSTLHFKVKFEGREEHAAARAITALLEKAYWEIGEVLVTYPKTTIIVILYSDQQFRDVTLMPSWSRGVFDGKIRLPISGFQRDQSLLKKIVTHEYAHAVIYDLCKSQIPTWLNEGIALNLEGTQPDSWKRALSNHISQGQDLIPLKQLHGSFMSFSNERPAIPSLPACAET